MRVSNFSETVTTPDGRVVKVSTYDDGSIKIKFNGGGPYAIEQAFLPGAGQEGNLHLIPVVAAEPVPEHWPGEMWEMYDTCSTCEAEEGECCIDARRITTRNLYQREKISLGCPHDGRQFTEEAKRWFAALKQQRAERAAAQQRIWNSEV